MSVYWDSRFLKHLQISNLKTVFEVGARYGDESIKLKNTFTNSIIHSFECNPLTVDRCRTNLDNIYNVHFNDFGLGEKEDNLPFYSYIKNNDGASSILKRIDFDSTQEQTGIIKIKRLEDYVKNNDIQNIDLLCMDVQGYELNVLKGAGNFIRNINYIIMEEPKPIINSNCLPKDVHSKYINAPSSQEIKLFMTNHGFVEVERIEENDIEDNVMYMSKITYDRIIINTVAKVGSANFLKCNYSQSKDISHGHSLLELQNILNTKSNSLIIVGVRNPIDRNLSYLFQTYNNEYYNNVQTKKNNYKGEYCYISKMVNNKFLHSEEIIDLYFEQKYHNTFNEWFEEFLDITKISKFNRDKGVDFYNFSNNNTIMIYTLEKLSENEKYIIDKLGIMGRITNINNSEKADYYKIYNEVKQTIAYSKKYVDNLVNTDIMRLFYNDNDIKYFLRKIKII